MAGEWKDIAFGNCAQRVSDVVQPYQVPENTPYIGLEHIVESGLHLNGQADASEATSAKTRFRRGDVLFGKLRPYFRKVVRPKFDGICSTDIWAVRAKNGMDQGFLFYRMASQEFVDKSMGASTGTRMPRADWEFLSQWKIPLPPLSEQKAIAAVLGALDDKIELNRRMNATLEAMARALFQSWFVDFDPVRAKLDGRKPEGLDEATAALFPGSFQDSSLGHIPKGWEVAELGQIADVIDCLHAKKPERRDNGQLYLQLNNIRDDGLIDISDSFFVSAEDYQKWISRMEAHAGDCMITNVGRVGAVAQIPEGVKGALGRNITGIRCKSSFQFPTFLVECLLSQSMREEIRLKTDSGTILDALNVKSIPKLRFVRPTREIGARFESLARPIRRQMEQNLSVSRNLANIRDTLLPKLLSGELSLDKIKDGLVS